MSEWLDPPSSMTGSTEAGRPQAQKDTLLVPVRSLAIELERTTSARDSRRQSMSRKTTVAPGNPAQPIQLTPLWEHVVRTRKFPPEIDTRLTFLEIAERLRDPEWEVRQHALRVLMDVLPTLNGELLDKVMQPVIPELINNLGHPAPAVRKGALDTIRVYLLHTQDKESIVKNILRDGLSRSEAHNPFQSNVTTGVILSAPSLLFPSSSSPSPGEELVRETTIALASRLAQVPHQEAVLKSLLKIREAIGGERFDGYLGEYDDKLKKNIGILSKIYNIRPGRKRRGNSVSARNVRNNQHLEKKEEQLDRKWDSDSDTSGIAEEEEDLVSGSGSMPGARVVLETEIKFNEETAITMTILEEKAEGSETELDDESGTDLRNDAEVAEVVGVSSIERKKTPRRVHFGGEIVKLRTPDSDETGSVELVPKTRIPLPVSPATKMPEHRRPSSQPCSPRRERKKLQRQARSASNSPKREVYIHNADLSPKKSILTRNDSPLYIIKPSGQTPKKRNAAKREEKELWKNKNENETSNKEDNVKIVEKSVEQIEEAKKESVLLVRSSETGFVPIESVETDHSSHKIISPNTVEVKPATPKEISEEQLSTTTGEERITKIDSPNSTQSAQTKSATFEAFPRQERNYILMELSSPESKGFRENKDEIDGSVNKEGLTNKWDNGTKSSLSARTSSIDVPNSPFGSVVDEVEIDRDFLVDLNINANPPHLSAPAPSRITSGRLEANSSEVSADAGSAELSAPDAIEGVVDSTNDNIERHPLKEGDSERGLKSDGDQKIVACAVKKATGVVSEGECKSKEPNWEELGLVGTEVLEDLHNREDWRARVRGLERVASALRTSSALIAIEPRLGSLLHAVLGCERSCRVAAAGLAVAKVVVTGVGEDALKRRLSLLAWGLARQGGPNAAQLARIAMLRLRPILFLEQLLQPQCLNARNAKTRENALQLLIFSLVTFPSTEFRVQAVASKVVKMVADRRRRVRQAALDTLAVLAQIYDPEEVLAAAKKAADRRHDGEAMLSAVRARLARKSLPLVSADGLVVYGLQISPTVQIATGPDVDWIVAGSGSVSPGTGRTRGQIIATTGTDRGRITRTLAGKNRSSPWMERPSLGLSIGSAEEAEQPVAWQIVPTEPEDDTGYQDQLNRQDERNNNTETSAGDCSRNPPQQESAERRKSVESVEFRPSAKTDELNNRQPDTASKSESRIPILSTARTKTLTSVRDRSQNLGVSVSSVIAGRRTFDTGFGGSTENMLGPYSTAYQRRKNYASYNPLSKGKNLSNVHTSYTTSVEVTSQETPENISKNYRRLSEKERFVERSEEKGVHPQSAVRTQRTSSSIQERSIQRQSGRFIDGTTYHRGSAPCRAMNGEGQYSQNRGDGIKNTPTRSKPGQRIKDAPHQKQNSAGFNSSEPQTNGHFPAIEIDPPYRRRLRSLSPSQMYHGQHYVRRSSREYQTASMYDIDKAVNGEEYNERNKILYFSEALDTQEVPLKSSATPAFEENNTEGSVSKSASNTSSEVSRSIDQASDEQSGQVYETGSGSSTPQSQETQAAFNVITNSAGSAFRESVEPFVIAADRKLEATVSGTISSVDDDLSKYWSSEEDTNSSVRARTVSRTEFHSVVENESNSTFDELEDAQEEVTNVVHVRRRSVISILSSERVMANTDVQASPEYPSVESPKNFQEIQASPKRKSGSPRKIDILSSPQSLGGDPISRPPTRTGSRASLQKSIVDETNEFGQTSEVKAASPTHRVENVSFQPLGTSSPSKERKDVQSPTIVIASRPHSNLADETVEHNLERRVSFGTVDDADRDSSANDTFDDRQSKDSASETNTEPAILRIESQTMEPIHPSRRLSSQMSRGTKPRAVGPRGVQEKAVEKSKAMVQQCFAQLENKDWEVALKGLKSLSQIAKQYPELLDLCGIGILGRILGRLIKSLRSQVARAACQAAGDLFAAHIRSIDQDVDDIAGPLLHRTADTNRFLRGDCNTALDRMVEHLPPHKTFGIIIHRGGNHQNPVVRAAGARLLCALVDRVGPEHTMILPRDTRDKLLNTGARLLTDGNVDARNYAKKMFKRLTRCEGFRKALTDAVPDSTLRHMDKALKAL